MMDEKPYECFVSEYSDTYEYAVNKDGIVKKIKKGHYQLIVPNGENTVVIDNIGTSFNPDYEASSRLLSIALRHGAPVEFIVEQLNKSGHFGSWGKTVAQVLKKTIKEGKLVLSSATCPVCGSSNLFYSEGCMTCRDCGGSRCG
jgi:ribonucleoside-diphosphate reductase alpha chain